MKRVVVDTHTLLWHLQLPKRLGAGARRLLKQADQGKVHVLIPAVVVVELTLVREAGRLAVGPAEVRALTTEYPNFEVLPLDLSQATEFALLGTLVDPFDRLIVAAARAADATLLTADRLITDSGLARVVWD
jgi:PIN domain nuclease of toxin-antitoxin system